MLSLGLASAGLSARARTNPPLRLSSCVGEAARTSHPRQLRQDGQGRALRLSPSLTFVQHLLPDPIEVPDSVLSVGEQEEASSETEAMLVKLWKQTLDVPQVGVSVPFDYMGGHSLLYAR